MRTTQKHQRPAGAGVLLGMILLLGPPAHLFMTTGSMVYSAIGVALWVAVYGIAAALLQL